jgi:hypothetical protein
VVPAQPGIDGPVAQVNEILKERGLFEIRPGTGEGEGVLRTGIEGIIGVIRICSDAVSVAFVKENIVGLEAGFPFVMAVVNGHGSAEIPFSKIVVLEDDDWPREGVRIEIAGVVADHATDAEQNVGRENVLIGGDAHGLEIVGGLELGWSAGRRRGLTEFPQELWILLDLLVGNFVAGEFVADAEREMVLRSEVALEACGEVADGTAVGEVLGDDGIEVVGGPVPGGAQADRIFSKSILQAGEGAGSVETASGEKEVAVKAGLGIMEGVDFNDTAHLAAVFGRNARGVDGDGVDVVGFDFGTEAG